MVSVEDILLNMSNWLLARDLGLDSSGVFSQSRAKRTVM
jgi:hypothetical protein